MEEREYFRTTARLHARLTQIARRSGQLRGELIRASLTRFLFVEQHLSPEEEAELERIMTEESQTKGKRARYGRAGNEGKPP